MNKLQRFGITVPEHLLNEYDRMLSEKGYKNRSEAIRDLIREKLVEEAWNKRHSTEIVAGTMALVYDHHAKGLSDTLIALQHEYYDIIMATIHIHLDTNNCLEVLVLKGEAWKLQRLGNQLSALRGIKHSKLTFSTTGATLA